MCEKLFVLFLRLYPARFREAYGEQAMQLVRDRAAHERGLVAGTRLWLDLLADMAASAIRGYEYGHTRVVCRSANGVPSFHLLSSEPPRRSALVTGGVLSLVVLVAFPAWISRMAPPKGPFSQVVQSVRSAVGRWSAVPDSAIASSERAPELKPLPEPPASVPHAAAVSAAVPAPPQAMKTAVLDDAARRRVIDAAAADLKRYYADPTIARKIADSLLSHEKNGDYERIAEGTTFADLLTTQIRNVSQDRHLDVVYSKDPLAAHPIEPTPERLARYRNAMVRSNCTFEKVDVLRGNIGYLKLNSFPDPGVCEAQARAAMKSVNNARAIIFDLRDNGGGYPDMVALIASYLFSRPECLYNPKESAVGKTQSPVPGSRLADKPVYILTSARTASAAEQFAFNLKMLKRAALIGEATRGVAHAAVFHRLDDHFGIGIPEVKPANPFSADDWEGTGVAPDVKVSAADALETAMQLAVRMRQETK